MVYVACGLQLVKAEVTDGHLALDATSKAVTAAAQLGEVTALCAGAGAISEAGAEVAKIDGVAKVLCAEDARALQKAFFDIKSNH